jgi:hypothetical protein
MKEASMSSNNAVYVLHVEWTYPCEYRGNVVTKERTKNYFFVFEGDVNLWGGLTRSGKLKKSAMWRLLRDHNMRRFDMRDNAYTYARYILPNQSVTEYGLRELSVTYHAK